LEIKDIEDRESEWQLKENIKNYLFSKGVNEEKIVVLIIDEGQKIPEDCLEILREFLNYETNNFKLLQIIIFAQKEFKRVLNNRFNLSDRINTLYYLKPLNFKQTRAMINYRIGVAGDLEKAPALFSFWALCAVYLSTKGYPRRVVSLCHQVILSLIIRGKKKAGFFLVRSSRSEIFVRPFQKMKWAAVSLLVLIVAGISITAAILHKNAIAYKQSIVIKQNPAYLESSEITVDSVIPSSISPNNAITLSIPDLAILQVDNNEYDVRIPAYIGRLEVEQGTTLFNILQNIYGNSGIKVTQTVMSANQIDKSLKIKAGAILNFPAIPVAVKIEEGKYFIQVKSGKDMGNIYNFFLKKSNERKITKSVFFPYWNEKEGMTFAVVIDECFDSQLSAQNRMNKLSPEIKENAKIISKWDANTVFINNHVFKCN
jgi:general secretion pathway protein A